MLTEQDGRESSAQIADRNGAWAPPTIMANCRVRMRLMARLQQLMASRRLTQVQAAVLIAGRADTDQGDVRRPDCLGNVVGGAEPTR